MADQPLLNATIHEVAQLAEEGKIDRSLLLRLQDSVRAQILQRLSQSTLQRLGFPSQPNQSFTSIPDLGVVPAQLHDWSSHRSHHGEPQQFSANASSRGSPSTSLSSANRLQSPRYEQDELGSTSLTLRYPSDSYPGASFPRNSMVDGGRGSLNLSGYPDNTIWSDREPLQQGIPALPPSALGPAAVLGALQQMQQGYATFVMILAVCPKFGPLDNHTKGMVRDHLQRDPQCLQRLFDVYRSMRQPGGAGPNDDDWVRFLRQTPSLCDFLNSELGAGSTDVATLLVPGSSTTLTQNPTSTGREIRAYRSNPGVLHFDLSMTGQSQDRAPNLVVYFDIRPAEDILREAHPLVQDQQGRREQYRTLQRRYEVRSPDPNLKRQVEEVNRRATLPSYALIEFPRTIYPRVKLEKEDSREVSLLDKQQRIECIKGWLFYAFPSGSCNCNGNQSFRFWRHDYQCQRHQSPRGTLSADPWKKPVEILTHLAECKGARSSVPELCDFVSCWRFCEGELRRFQ